jgi:hypothetical protein
VSEEATTGSTCRWCAPPLGWYKVTWDMALTNIHGFIGMGVVIRDLKGSLVVARCTTVRGHLNLNTSAAEAMVGVQVVACFFQELGLEHIYLERDAKTLRYGRCKQGGA